jgi:RecA/RadA recombinase
MLAMHAMANAQQLFKDPIVAYLDSEQSTTTTRLANLGVVNPRIKPYDNMTIEKVFKILEGVCLFKESKKIINTPSLIIWDSIANTLSQKEIEAEDMNKVIGYKARLLSLLIPKYVAKSAQYNICFLAINQLRDVLDMGMFSAPRDLKFMSSTKDMPGGQTLKFNAFQLLEFKHGGVIDIEKYGISGVKAKIKAVKNKLFPPNIEVEVLGDFSRGFSNFHTNYNFLVSTERLSSGAWNTLVSYPTKKFRTKDAFETYNTDPAFKEAFDSSVNEALNSEILSRANI